MTMAMIVLFRFHAVLAGENARMRRIELIRGYRLAMAEPTIAVFSSGPRLLHHAGRRTS